MTKEKKAIWRKEKIANGMCPRCGRPREDDGYYVCKPCRERESRNAKIIRAKRKAEGICVTCGKSPAREGRNECPICAERHRKATYERRKWYLENDICPMCGRNRLEGNKRLCLDCLEYERNRRAKREDRDSERIKDHIYYVKIREKRKSEKLCCSCGKRPAREGRTQCAICAAKSRIRSKRARGGLDRHEYPNYGICFQCCKRPVVEGKKLCAECIEMAMRNLGSNRNISKWRDTNRFLYIHP